MTQFIVPDRSAIASVAATASASGYGHATVLLEAVQSGLIGLLIPMRQTSLSRRQLRRLDIPTILLIGDDDYASTGPSGWACAEAVSEWAGGVIIHAAGATPAEYRKAVLDALRVQRLVFVETSSKCVDGWLQNFSTKPIHIDVIKPRGGLHPLPIARGQVQ